MTQKQKDQILLAIELIMEDGMGVSAAAQIVGEMPETVEKWLTAYREEQEEKLRQQDAEMRDLKKRIAEHQIEIAIHRRTYDHILDHPDPTSEKIAKKNWEKMPESVRRKIITNAFCIDCGATIITDFLLQGDDEGITLYGKCGKCGKSMATSVEVPDK